ncbi:hypothetical protein L9F63_028018, partial [Diploptera punctata]
ESATLKTILTNARPIFSLCPRLFKTKICHSGKKSKRRFDKLTLTSEIFSLYCAMKALDLRSCEERQHSLDEDAYNPLYDSSQDSWTSEMVTTDVVSIFLV